ncbi:MAG TPA: arylesterase [Pseudothauera hydrothermalis]|uniref:arylesterase n=1 Tax=Pseudothauera hydrothermalis TaxID=2184083 RepID=UPI000C7DD7AE|nr:arylesterase [Pseudothauera hydrothermalis]AUM01484.1 arylesterase [Rhodocyclaceae bacterium]AVZ80683.1 arylesterase [Zoogloeaceae bacteirum Par-f-2]HNQ76346.1 arylesterase [Pseudothauera hydrothermalis]
MPLRSMVTFLFVLFAGGAQAATILVWGDSLSAGYGLRPDQAWPTLLQTRLAREGFPHRVVNASVSGETSAGGRSRLPAALARYRPDVLILALGANDGLRGLPPEHLADNLGAMIEAAHRAGARVLLAGMQMPPNYGPVYTRRFAETFARVAQAHKVALLPFLLEGFAERRALFQPDGLHPTADAQPLILDNVWPRLMPLLGDGKP